MICGGRPSALRWLLAGIEGMRFFSRERLPSRDELREAVIVEKHNGLVLFGS
jgi:hypothetical protein